MDSNITENQDTGVDTEPKEHTNSLTFEDKVIKKIAGMAAGEISGILAMSGNLISGLTDMLRSSDDPTKGISVEVGKKQVAIDMKVTCEYGRKMPEVFNELVQKVSTAVNEMTGLEVVELNVHVIDILTKEDFDRKRGVEVRFAAPDDIPELPPAQETDE